MKIVYGCANGDPEKAITPVLMICSHSIDHVKATVLILGWWDYYVGISWAKVVK